jgi:hypothetical protein
MIEGVTNVAHNAVEAFRATPALLAVVLLQLATIAVVFFISRGNAERAQIRELALIERCYPQPQSGSGHPDPTRRHEP